MIDTATILVADDSAEDVELLRLALEKAGLKNPVQSLEDGTAVIEYLNRDSSAQEASFPLLMFLDLSMPRGTGFAVLDWLRRQPVLQSLPTIVFSNSEDRSDIERCFRLGALGYWVKPASFDDLVSKLRALKELLGRVVEKVEVELAVPAGA